MKITEIPGALEMTWFIDREQGLLIYQSSDPALWYAARQAIFDHEDDHGLFGLVNKSDYLRGAPSPYVITPDGCLRLCRTSYTQDWYEPYEITPAAPPQPLFTVSYESENSSKSPA